MPTTAVESLKPQNQPAAQQFADSIADGQWIRFWSEKSVQLDAELSLEELKRLTALMESFT